MTIEDNGTFEAGGGAGGNITMAALTFRTDAFNEERQSSKHNLLYNYCETVNISSLAPVRRTLVHAEYFRCTPQHIAVGPVVRVVSRDRVGAEDLESVI